MPTKTFNTEDLISMLYEDDGPLELVSDKSSGTTRWSDRRLLVFRDTRDSKLYRTDYSKGLTEYQDEQAFEDNEPTTECIEVEEYTKEVKAYRPVPNG